MRDRVIYHLDNFIIIKYTLSGLIYYGLRQLNSDGRVCYVRGTQESHPRPEKILRMLKMLRFSLKL